MERQFIRLGFSFIVMFGLAQAPLGVFRFFSTYAYGAGLLMLIAVLLFGDMGKGAQRWLDLGFIRFQPSELMKLAVPMMVAWYISKFTMPPRTTHIIVGFGLVVVPTILIAKQPDLGTSLLIASSGIFAIFLAGMSWRLISVVGGLIGAFAPVMWFFLMKDYQKQRVLTFLNPESDPLGSGYHIIQSKIAIGSGGVNGKGWLQGTQSQLEFLPERHTDFIFSVFAEETGFIGVIILLSIYLFIILKGLNIAFHARDRFGLFLALGIVSSISFYFLFNLGMSIGLFPITGLPLPLVSYGGSSLVTNFFAFGLLLNIGMRRNIL